MLKAGTIVLLVLFIIAGAYSLVDVFAPHITLEGDAQAVTGGSIEDAFAEGPLFIAKLYLRHMGVASLAVAVASIFILLEGFAREQRWAWWALLLVGLIVVGFTVVVNAVIANWFDFATHLVILVWLFVGLLLPVKVFFGKKAGG